MPYILIVSTVMGFPSLAAADHDEAGTATTNSSKRSILGKKSNTILIVYCIPQVYILITWNFEEQ